MRILANFTKKVNTGSYENETYTVTFEAVTEFNNLEQVSDFLFHEARHAVERQLDGSSAKEFSFSVPTVTTQKEETGDELDITDLDAEEAAQKEAEKKEEKPEVPAPPEAQKRAVKASRNGSKKQEAVTQPTFPNTSGNDKGNGEGDTPFLLITDKQIKMLFRLAHTLGYDKNDIVGYLKQEAEKLNPSLSVEHLNQIPRKVASRLIEKLLQIQREVAA